MKDRYHNDQIKHVLTYQSNTMNACLLKNLPAGKENLHGSSVITLALADKLFISHRKLKINFKTKIRSTLEIKIKVIYIKTTAAG